MPNAHSQQFVNGGLDPHPDLAGGWGADCHFRHFNQEYVNNAIKNGCNISQGSHIYSSNRIIGFDTLSLEEAGATWIEYPMFENKRNFYELYMRASLNIDTMQNFGWSLALNRELQPNTRYRLSVMMNQDDYVRWFGDTTGLKHNQLDYYQDYAQWWYVRVGLSENPNVQGDSIGSITMKDFVQIESTFFEYLPQFQDWNRRMQLFYRHHLFKTPLFTGYYSGKYLTFNVVSKPQILPFITAKRSDFSCVQTGQYNNFKLKMDNFSLECVPEIRAQTDSCTVDGLRLLTELSGHHHIWNTGDTGHYLTVTMPGKYWVDTEYAGCRGTDTFVVTQVNVPAIEQVQHSVCQDSILKLKSNFLDAFWYVNNELIHSGNSYTHQSSESTAIVVNTPKSCSQWDTIQVSVKPCGEIHIPNAFSPNGDGLNEVYRVLGAKAVEMKVFTLWGEHIHSGDSWDGRYKGSLVEQGLYLIQLHIETLNGIVSNKVEVVQLLR